MAAFTRKFGVIVALVAMFGGAGVASAQTYYYSTPSYSLYDQAAYAGSCVNLSRDLYQGMSGQDVRVLQQFLVSRNYPGGGDWMITGYFGAATAAAVRNFQSAQGLQVSGHVDAQTRLALDRVSCGDSYYGGAAYQYQQPYTTPTYALPTPPSIPTAFPQYQNQYGNGCPGYQAYPNNYYSGYYGYTGIGTLYTVCDNNTGDQSQFGTPAITRVDPQAGGVGAAITIYGTGFSTTGNTVHFGNGVIANVGSPDHKALTFTVPANLTGFGKSVVGLGTYYVSVTNAVGNTSNTVPFTVTALGAAGAPTITNVSGPTTLGVNVQGVWTLTVNNPGGGYLTASVQWGDPQFYGYGQGAPQQIIGTGAQTLTFTHAYAQAGTYTVQFTVVNAAGQSNISTATVTVSGTGTGSLSVSSITPTSGHTGTQIAIQGSGFSLYDNTVHFGSGGTMHVPSYNGTTIYYTIPQYLSPCDVNQGGVCAQYLQFVTPGTYPVSVQNGSATSNTVNFTVTQ